MAGNQGRAVEWAISGLPEVKGDRDMLKQAFVNLLSNAVKYSRGSASSMVEVVCSRQGAAYVVSVRDNGVGFNMDYSDRLFGVFQRLHRSEDFEGAGIGLSIVRRVAARHGGKVWAESSPGQGATFFFFLPAGRE